MSSLIANILAGGEFDSPADAPSSRIDGVGEFSFVGSLEVFSGTGSFYGSGVALSPEWILTAGHNVDLNDDGSADAGWSGVFYLPGHGNFEVSQVITHSSYSGFANPSINDDLALLRLTNPLPPEMFFPPLGGQLETGEVVTLVGFGRSGYGSYGYTSNATLTDRRFGSNIVDSLALDDEGTGTAEIFRYDFDDPSNTCLGDGSLGNDVETIIGPGDSGGAALRKKPDGSWELVGINTFTEGFGGVFGDVGGGVLIDPYEEWIMETTGIPEPVGAMLCFVSLPFLVFRRIRITK